MIAQMSFGVLASLPCSDTGPALCIRRPTETDPERDRHIGAKPFGDDDPGDIEPGETNSGDIGQFDVVVEDPENVGTSDFEHLDFDRFAALVSENDNSNEPDAIIGVTLQFPYESEMSPFGPCIIRCTEPGILTLVFREIRKWGATRLILPKSDLLGGWAVPNVAWLEIHTASAKFRLTISKQGFALNGGRKRGQVHIPSTRGYSRC
jgi:hypothetical protein